MQIVKHTQKKVVFIFLFLVLTFLAHSQQITRFAVVDTARVYQSYYKNSSAVRNYENKKTEFQNEINKRTQELQTLNQQKLDLEAQGNDTAALKIETQITKKADYLQEYSSAKNQELESLKKTMQNSDQFYKRLYSVLGNLAESGGYSMILSLQQANAILWYSPSVDLTDQVIAQLGL